MLKILLTRPRRDQHDLCLTTGPIVRQGSAIRALLSWLIHTIASDDAGSSRVRCRGGEPETEDNGAPIAPVDASCLAFLTRSRLSRSGTGLATCNTPSGECEYGVKRWAYHVETDSIIDCIIYNVTML